MNTRERETADPPTTVSRSTDLIELLRPTHWIKNVVVFAAPAAGLKLSSPTALGQTLLAFVAFCLASSSVYAINDAVDREADAKHPTKRHRPVARGAIRPLTAVLVAAVLIAVALLTTALLLNRGVTTVLAVYFGLTLAYTLALKRRVILDVIVVALGFVLRAWAGALAVGVPASDWLMACVFTLCLFMGFGKRRCEVVMLGNEEDARQHRRTLVRYTPDLLTHLITVSAGIAVITFLLYTLDTAGHPSPFHKEHLFFTLPIVVYGIFRFAMVTELGLYSGPTEIVFRDRALMVAIIVWAACALVIAYQVPLFGPEGLTRFFVNK